MTWLSNVRTFLFKEFTSGHLVYTLGFLPISGCAVARLPACPRRTAQPEGRRREAHLFRKGLRRGRQVLLTEASAWSYLPLRELLQIS